jgi:hypothetical protein
MPPGLADIIRTLKMPGLILGSSAVFVGKIWGFLVDLFNGGLSFCVFSSL